MDLGNLSLSSKVVEVPGEECGKRGVQVLQEQAALAFSGGHWWQGGLTLVVEEGHVSAVSEPGDGEMSSWTSRPIVAPEGKA